MHILLLLFLCLKPSMASRCSQAKDLCEVSRPAIPGFHLPKGLAFTTVCLLLQALGSCSASQHLCVRCPSRFLESVPCPQKASTPGHFIQCHSQKGSPSVHGQDPPSDTVS